MFPEISSPLVDLPTMAACISAIRTAQMDFFKVPDNRGGLSIGLGTLSALNPSSRQRSEVNSTYNCEANITYSSDLTHHISNG